MIVATAGHIDHGQDHAGACVDWYRYGPAARGEGTRHLHRSRVCPPHATRRSDHRIRRCPGARTVHPQHAQWRLCRRPCDSCGRRRRRRHAADPRAPAHRQFAGRSECDSGHHQARSRGPRPARPSDPRSARAGAVVVVRRRCSACRIRRHRRGNGCAARKAGAGSAAARHQDDQQSGAMARYVVDRVFTAAGSGTVVTGTVIAGSIGVGDTLVVSPAGTHARVRKLQRHGSTTERAHAGERCAINVVNVKQTQVARGDWLVAAEAHNPTDRMDVQVRVLESESTPL